MARHMRTICRGVIVENELHSEQNNPFIELQSHIQQLNLMLAEKQEQSQQVNEMIALMRHIVLRPATLADNIVPPAAPVVIHNNITVGCESNGLYFKSHAEG
jgi:hypothetical protein